MNVDESFYAYEIEDLKLLCRLKMNGDRNFSEND